MKTLSTLIILLICTRLCAQDSLSSGVVKIPSNYASSVDKKINGLDDNLTKQSQKYLKDFARQEEKLLKELSKIDSSAAASMLKSGKDKYENSASNSPVRTVRLVQCSPVNTYPGWTPCRDHLVF